MKRAVTLLELIVVMAIIGITAAIAAPAISNYLPGVQLSGSARVLSGNLRQAQERAITEQKQYLIRFYPDENPKYYELRRINNGAEELQDTTTLANGESLTPDPSITTDPVSHQPQIAFSPDGGPSSSGNITLSINGVNKVINVSPAGFIAIY